MRPPDLPGGNALATGCAHPVLPCFNEAAGFTRRKQVGACSRLRSGPSVRRFNEAAGFTRRKLITSTEQMPRRRCFNEAAGFTRRKP